MGGGEFMQEQTRFLIIFLAFVSVCIAYYAYAKAKYDIENEEDD